MRAVVQRVKAASVAVHGVVVGAIDAGLIVFLGVAEGDLIGDVDWMVDKITKLRVFEDEAGKMNRSILETKGDVLVISQFTLLGSLKKGTRPSFNKAANPLIAKEFYKAFTRGVQNKLGKTVPTGVFGAYMLIDVKNDGPVTLIIDSKRD